MILDDYLAVLRAKRAILAEQFKVNNIGIFGSFVRGEQHENSDIDILVDFEDDADLFDLTGLALFLEQVFQRNVDVVPKAALRSELRPEILREVISV